MSRPDLALGPWVHYAPSAWSAQDGPDRQFNVGRDAHNNGRTWGAVLHDSTTRGQPTKTIPISEGLRTMREAKESALAYARNLPAPESIPRPSVIASGQRWRPNDGGPPWRIVSITPDQIGLSGPGPCRSMMYLTVEELEAGWGFYDDGERKR